MQTNEMDKGRKLKHTQGRGIQVAVSAPPADVGVQVLLRAARVCLRVLLLFPSLFEMLIFCRRCHVRLIRIVVQRRELCAQLGVVQPGHRLRRRLGRKKLQ